VGAEIDLFRSEGAELGNEFGAVLHVGVVRLVRAEEAPDWLEVALWGRGVHSDGNGERRLGILGDCREREERGEQEGAKECWSAAHGLDEFGLAFWFVNASADGRAGVSE